MKTELFNLRKKYEDGECPEISFQLPDGEEIYKRRFQKPTRLIILGGGYIAQALCHFATELEFEVVVTDDRPAFANWQLFPQAAGIVCDAFDRAIDQIDIRAEDYVVVATRGHKQDADCLRILLADDMIMPAYIGMLGSRRRVRELFHMLEGEGYDPIKMEQIHTPIGLPIGAITPEEISISILAELLQCRCTAYKRSGGILEQTNVDLRVLSFLEKPEEKVIALVIERNGSTPVKSGAIMAIDRLGNAYGTVGGGCSEHDVIMKAMQVFRQQKDCTMLVDMSNDVAMEEGMACGGRMWLALYYIPQMEQVQT